MDLRMYYQKIREWETKIVDEFPIVASKETGDGGKAGTMTEVPKALAAKLIVDGMAELATDAELENFRTAVAEAQRLAESRLATTAAMQLTLVPKQELDSLRANQVRGKE